MDVIANTVAMSKPHEIAYTLTFHSDTIQKEQGENKGIEVAIILLCIVGAITGVTFLIIFKNKKKVHNV